MKFQLVEAEKAEHPVSLLCALLGVTRAGYYAWRGRAPSRRERQDRELERLIRRVFADSHETYGAPRVHAELQDEHDLRVSRKRVARLMRELGLEGVSRRGKRRLPARAASETAAAPDLVRRDFRAAGPDRLWVADITYVPTWEGFLFLACVVDAWSRRCVGWSMRNDLRSELVIDALGMALQGRRPSGSVIHHSDRGSQGGFNWSSQHLVMEVVRDGCGQASAGDSCDARADVVAGPAFGRTAGRPRPVLAVDRGRRIE